MAWSFFLNIIAAGYDAAYMASFHTVWSSFFPVLICAPFPACSREGQQGLAISPKTQVCSTSEAVGGSWPLHIWQVLCSYAVLPGVVDPTRALKRQHLKGLSIGST